MTEIPTATKQLLDKIITDQEGGWKLTSNVNDPDGGWTYAGVTAESFCHWHLDAYEGGKLITATELQEHYPADVLKELIYECYYQEYVEPLQLDKLPTILQGPVLSCAINRGVETAVKILQISAFPYLIAADCDGKIGSKTLAAIEKFNDTTTKTGHSEILANFLREWTRSYIHLVVENAKAWHEIAIEPFEHETHDDSGLTSAQEKDHPSVFRADSLEGWFNRVEYWRGQ